MLFFADDVVIYSRNSNLASTTLNLKSSILDFNNCIHELQLYLAPQKCKSVLFTLRPFNPIVSKIQLHDYQFDRLPSFQYLGAVLDSKLSWKPHISNIRNRAFSACNILKSLSPSSWGGDPTSLLLFYKSFVQNIIDYGLLHQRPWNHPSPSGTGAKPRHQTGTWSHQNYSHSCTPSRKQNPVPLI